ncbi:hypothetical protein BX666DRAFT_2018509 [Dichotomocladium elegans]|nr:hypothetical protein BX666DRAFT_2018509 [Dichotomocladium elegans]
MEPSFEYEPEDLLTRELEEIKLAVERTRKDVIVEAERRQALQQTYEDVKRQLQDEEKEYSQVENLFFSHTRSVKATDDDLSTIRDTFKLLKYSIARMIMSLNKKAEFEHAQQKFIKKWPELCRTGELDVAHINLLAEKLVHEHLVLHIFRCPIHPGLEINDAYKSVSDWLTAHGSDFAIRLRQQLACIIAKSLKDSSIQQASQSAKKNVVDLIYDDLADIYHPYIRENDATMSEDKRYYTKIADIVDKATRLAVAIRGQDVDITTLDIEEGEAPFDDETMVDVKGTVRFCISPPFVGGDGEHGFIEKGKVVVS